MIAENQPEQPNQPGDGGGGGIPHDSERTESGLLATREARIYGRAVREKWYKGQRWPTEITDSELERLKGERELTMKEQAAEATLAGLSNPRAAHIHVRNAIAMEAQNMEQEERDNPAKGKPGVTVNIQNNGGTITLDERRVELLGILDSVRKRVRAGADPSPTNGHSNGHGPNGSQPG